VAAQVLGPPALCIVEKHQLPKANFFQMIFGGPNINICPPLW
jgi:hypothetical protein